MVLVLKKLKVWTPYMHIAAQINHRGLGLKVETTSPENQTIVTSNFQYLRYLHQRDRENELYTVMQFISL